MSTRELQQSNPSESVSAQEVSENMDPADGWTSFTSFSDEDQPENLAGIVLMVDGKQVGACHILSRTADKQGALQAAMVCDGIADALNSGAELELITSVANKLARQDVSGLNLVGYKLMDSFLAEGHRTTVFLRADTDDVLIREGYFNIDHGSAKEWLNQDLDSIPEPEVDL